MVQMTCEMYVVIGNLDMNVIHYHWPWNRGVSMEE